MTNKIIIAIDGFSASGKGTISKGLAEYFRFAHLDTGLLYRSVGRMTFEQDPLMSSEVAIKIAQNFTTERFNDSILRNDETSQLASKVAAIAEVRTALLNFQRNFAIAPPADGAVIDGRDIGTVICPLAPVKLFVTASSYVRAQRRHKELEAVFGKKIPFDTILKELQERDERDVNRAVAPLKPADDAVIIDTTEMSIHDAILKSIKITQKIMQDNNQKFACI
jgi:cytidylate kinase